MVGSLIPSPTDEERTSFLAGLKVLTFSRPRAVYGPYQRQTASLGAGIGSGRVGIQRQIDAHEMAGQTLQRACHRGVWADLLGKRWVRSHLDRHAVEPLGVLRALTEDEDEIGVRANRGSGCCSGSCSSVASFDRAMIPYFRPVRNAHNRFGKSGDCRFLGRA